MKKIEIDIHADGFNIGRNYILYELEKWIKEYFKPGPFELNNPEYNIIEKDIINKINEMRKKNETKNFKRSRM